MKTTNPLELIPHRYRAAIYGVVLFASICFTAWQVSDGDWVEALGYVLGILGGGVAVSNVRPHGRPGDSRHVTVRLHANTDGFMAKLAEARDAIDDLDRRLKEPRDDGGALTLAQALLVAFAGGVILAVILTVVGHR